MQLTKNDLAKHYFYKTELIHLCRERRLPTYGTKAELNYYLSCYLDGVPSKEIQPLRTNNQKALTKTDINLDTKLIGEGFTFNEHARLFFANYYHVKKFSFKKEMAIIKRRVETQNQTEYTVRDLIKELENSKKIVNTPEEQTYQWNNFVRDFNQDPASKEFTSRLKVAAILWKFVRESEQPKEYSHALLQQYLQQIQDL